MQDICCRFAEAGPGSSTSFSAAPSDIRLEIEVVQASQQAPESLPQLTSTLA